MPAVPRRVAVTDLMVNGAGRTVRAPWPGVVATRRAADDARLRMLDMCVMRCHQCRIQLLLLLATAGVSVDHLAECSRVVNVITT